MRDEHQTDSISSLCLMSNGSATLLTGTTVETVLAELLLPAEIIGPHTYLKLTQFWSQTNNANVKTVRQRVNGTLISTSLNLANQAQGQIMCHGLMRGSVQAQIWNGSLNVPYVLTTGALLTTAIDMSVDTTLTITGQLASAGDTMTLEGYILEVLNPR